MTRLQRSKDLQHLIPAIWRGIGKRRGVKNIYKMAGTGFDDPGVFFSDSFFPEDRSESEHGELSRTASLKRFKEFLKTFLDHENCFCYR